MSPHPNQHRNSRAVPLDEGKALSPYRGEHGLTRAGRECRDKMPEVAEHVTAGRVALSGLGYFEFEALYILVQL